MGSRSTCRSCTAEIEWALTEAERRIPLDPGHDPAGNLAELPPAPGIPLRVRAIAAGEIVDPGVRRRVSHFATCPQAASHRKKDRKARRP